MRTILNPYYILKPDNGRAFLQVKDEVRAKESERYNIILHPIFAMILSCFDGDDYESSINRAANYLHLDKALVRKFVDKITENENFIKIIFDNRTVYFPPRTIIRSETEKILPRHQCRPSDFTYSQLNISFGRHQMINDVMLMITTKCKTDCLYCYATKEKRNASLPLPLVEKIVNEAVQLKVRSVDIIGGDIFTHKNWRDIVKLLYKNGYTPFLSTKVELSESDISFLKSIGVKDIQISLDTLIKKNLLKIVRRKEDYYNKILLTLDLLEKYNIETVIHSIISSENSDVIDMKSIYDYIKNKRNIKVWRIDPATYSIPKGEENFIHYRAKSEDLQKLSDFFNNNHFDLPVRYSSLALTTGKPAKRQIHSNDFFKNRRLCTANYSSLFVLPDGQVTICEQLYWNPHFIVGDITRQSLAEIWNSEKALNLYYLQQNTLSDKSHCKTCKYFIDCRQKMGGVCWKEVISAYGTENWDFPDPSCPFAPDPYHDVYIK